MDRIFICRFNDRPCNALLISLGMIFQDYKEDFLGGGEEKLWGRFHSDFQQGFGRRESGLRLVCGALSKPDDSLSCYEYTCFTGHRRNKSPSHHFFGQHERSDG